MQEETMDLPGEGYSYALATLSMTFAGFSAIVIVLRQTLGRPLSPFHLLVTRLYIESGFWAAAFGMLPPLLALCGLPAAAAWRVSSAVVALVLIAYGATYPMRRRRITQDALPSRRWIAIAGVSVAVIAALACNVIGFPYRPNPGPIAVAATWTLACGAIVFLLALERFWQAEDGPSA
jgi:hypothetical protein